MSRAYRFTTNSRPQDYRSGIRPMADNPRRGTIRLALIIAVLFVLLVTVGSETGRAILHGATP